MSGLAPSRIAILLHFAAVIAYILLISFYVRAAPVQPSNWLRDCRRDNHGEVQCSLAVDVDFAAADAKTGPVVIALPLKIEGSGDGGQQLNFSGGTDLFFVAPNATVAIRRLHLLGVKLDEPRKAGPYPFLNLRALNFSIATATTSTSSSPFLPSVSPQQPQLSLSDVQITTNSCAALAFQQTFVCSAPPSPNFTVAPGLLVVHSYTSPGGLLLQARNVTLRCSGPSVPHPCWARTVGNAAELLAVLEGAADPAPVPGVTALQLQSVPVLLHISRNITLRDAAAATDTNSLAIYATPLVLSGGPIAAVLRGPLPPVALDLAGTASRFTFATDAARLELRNLTLLNPPLGPPLQYPSALLALPLWTFSTVTDSIGSFTWRQSVTRIDARGIAVQLSPSELALWHMDFVGTVTEELLPAAAADGSGGLCAYSNPLLSPGTGKYGTPGKGPWWATALPGGGLFVNIARSKYMGFRWYEQVLLLPSPSQLPTQSSSNLTAVAAAPLPPLCQLRPGAFPAATGTAAGGDNIGTAVRLTGVARPAAKLNPLALEKVQILPDIGATNSSSSDVSPDLTWQIVLTGDSVLCVDPCMPSESNLRPEIYSAFRTAQARIWNRFVVLGDPQGPRLLHMSYAAATFNIRAAAASLTLRQLVLSGLPPAGLHPTSTAWSAVAAAAGGDGGGGGGGAQFYGDGGWRSSPLAAGSRRRHGDRRRLRGCLHGSVSAVEEKRGTEGHDGMLGAMPRGTRGEYGVTDARISSSNQRRRLAQVAEPRAIAAGKDPTGGLTPALTNFTSCLWSLDFDRRAAAATAAASATSSAWGSTPLPYRVFLDSVVLLLPPEELALIAWVWAEHFEAAASDKSGSSSGGSNSVSSEKDFVGGSGAEPVVAFEAVEPKSAAAAAMAGPASLATAGAVSGGVAGELLQLLRAMPQFSRLSGRPWAAAALTAAAESSATAAAVAAELWNLTARLLVLAAARRRQLLSSGLIDTGSNSNSITLTSTPLPANSPWWEDISAGGANCSNSSAAEQPDAAAALTFDVFAWCALTGRNVTLAAAPLPGLAMATEDVNRLWLGWPLELPLALVPRRRRTDAPAPPPSAPPLPVPSAQSLTPEPRPEASSPPPRPSQPPPRLVTDDMYAALSPPPATFSLPSGIPGSRPDAIVTWAVVAPMAGLGAVLCLTAALVPLMLRRRRLHRQQKPGSPAGATAAAALVAPDAAAEVSAAMPLGPYVVAVSALLQQQVDAIKHELSTAAAVGAAAPAVPAVTSASPHVGNGSDGRQQRSLQGPRDKGYKGSAWLPPGGPSGGGSCGGGGPCCSPAVAEGGEEELVLLEPLGRGAHGVVCRGLWRGLTVAVKSSVFQSNAQAADVDVPADGDGDDVGGGDEDGRPDAARDTPQQQPHLRRPLFPRSPVREAAIAASLSHPNVVATYCHLLHRLEPHRAFYPQERQLYQRHNYHHHQQQQLWQERHNPQSHQQQQLSGSHRHQHHPLSMAMVEIEISDGMGPGSDGAVKSIAALRPCSAAAFAGGGGCGDPRSCANAERLSCPSCRSSAVPSCRGGSQRPLHKYPQAADPGGFGPGGSDPTERDSYDYGDDSSTDFSSSSNSCLRQPLPDASPNATSAFPLAAAFASGDRSSPYQHGRQRQQQPVEGSGGEAEMWRLMLVQELCDLGSVRQCLDAGQLAACSVTAAAAEIAGAEGAPATAGAAVHVNVAAGTAAAHAAGDGDGGGTAAPLPAARAVKRWLPRWLLLRGEATAAAQQPTASSPPPASTTQPITAASGAITEAQRSGQAGEPEMLVTAPEAASQPLTGGTSAAAAITTPTTIGTRTSTLTPTYTAAAAVALALQVARGMEYIHSLGVLHGDLSSANVLLQSCAQPPCPQVLPPSSSQQPMQQPQPDWQRVADCPGSGRSSKAAGDARGGSHSAAAGGIPCAAGVAADGSGGCWVTGPCDRRFGFGYVAKVADFGLSGRLVGGRTHLCGECRRSSLYSAPELVQYGTCSKGTDVYAFAVLMYELIVGVSLPRLLQDPARGAGLRGWLRGQQQGEAATGSCTAAAAAALPPSLLVWPDHAPDDVVRLVAECLAPDPVARPSFRAIVARLTRQLGQLLPPL